MDERTTHIITSCREHLLRNPQAPMADLAKTAGVGMSALYRRFENRDSLIAAIALDGLQRYVRITRAALDDGDPSIEVFRQWLVDISESGALRLGPVLAGKFHPTASHHELAAEGMALTEELLAQRKQAGAIRPEAQISDLILMLEAIGALRFDDSAAMAAARCRLIDLWLAGISLVAIEPCDPVEREVLVRRWTSESYRVEPDQPRR